MLDMHGRTYFNKLLGQKHFEVFERMFGKVNEEASIVDRRKQLFLRDIIKFWSENGNNISITEMENIARHVIHADVSVQDSQFGMEDYVGSFTDRLYAVPPAPTRLEDVEIPKEYQTHMAMRVMARQELSETDKPIREEIAAARALFSRPWFSRIWIVQEVIMAKEVVFSYGFNTFPGWAIYAGMKIACDFDRLLQVFVLSFMTVWEFRRALCRSAEHKHVKHKGLRDIISLLTTFRQRDATDPRDKVYALLGITSTNIGDFGVTIRYDRSVAETYTETAIGIIKFTRKLSILDLLKPVASPIPHLPSWVPDWSDTTQFYASLCNTKGSNMAQNGVTKDYAATADSTVTKMEAFINGRLSILGYVFDIITEVGPAMPVLDTEVDIMNKSLTHCTMETMRDKVIQLKRGYVMARERNNIYQAWWSLAHAGARDSTSLYPTGEDPTEVYKSTLQTRESTSSNVTIDEFLAWNANNADQCIMLQKLDSYAIDSIFRHDGRPGVACFQFFNLVQEITTKQNSLRFNCTAGRTLVRTANGYLGLAPKDTMAGDSVALLEGAKTPIILREKGEEWSVTGPAYVHGTMSGELWDDTQCQTMVLA
ncbi:hypothetical protein N0V90_013507 [Kalmusia sp. IMI 367209]|nr:hypothetical protein N0V90_013507 [Kalmusia sp. IMI 367209]